MRDLESKRIGTFEVKSGKVRISDPCYELDTWCAGTINKVRKGVWQAEVIKSDEGSWGNRCAVLLAYHKDFTVDHDDGRFINQDIDVGVDSGQAGIFDLKHFKDDGIVANVERVGGEPICADEPWYSICCDRTLSEEGAGIIPFGCVSSSGYGDGSYICSTITDTYNPKCEVVAIKIDFGIIEEVEECYNCGNEFNAGELIDGLCDNCCEDEEDED